MKTNNKFNSGTGYPSYRFGGTVVNIIVGLIFLGLLAAGIMWIMKSAGDMTEDYTTAAVKTKNKSLAIECQNNLRNIGISMRMFEFSMDELPDSYEGFVDMIDDSRFFECPEPNSPGYKYIPGQNFDSPGDNILLYEPAPVHNGGCNVLKIDGSVGWLTPEVLKTAIEQTKAHLRR